MKTLKFFITIISISIFSLTAKGQSCTNCSGGTVTGTNASGLGTTPTATGNSSLAGGLSSIARGNYSIAFGQNALVNTMGQGGIALGTNVESHGPGSVTIGRFLKCNTGASVVIGSGAGSAYLENSVSGSLMVGFNSSFPTLFVGNSSGSSATGRVAIGNMTSPTAKLHIFSDENEAAEIKLEHRTSGSNQFAQIYFGTHTIRAGNNENMVFTTPTSRNFIFTNGKVGIGSSEPIAKLQINDGDIYIKDINRGIIMTSPDGNCWRGVLNNQGQLEFTLLPDCSGTQVATQAPERKPGISIQPNPARDFITILTTEAELARFSHVKLIDASGKVIQSITLSQTSTQIATSSLNPDVYFLNFSGNGAYWTEKVVIQ
jgi:hypothetical protein